MSLPSKVIKVVDKAKNQPNVISPGFIYYIIQHLEDGFAEAAGGDLQRTGPAVAESPGAADAEAHAAAPAQHLGHERGGPRREQPVGVPAVDVERLARRGVHEVGAVAARERHPRLQPRHRHLEAAAAGGGGAEAREPVEVDNGEEEEEAEEAVKPPLPPHWSAASASAAALVARLGGLSLSHSVAGVGC